MALIEMLYPEVCCLFGDTFNVNYLAECEPDIEVVRTGLNDRPAFLTRPVSMIYMGPMPENVQEIVIEKLRPYRDKLQEMIENDGVFLAVGNAMEIFGQYIEYEEKKMRLPGLGLLPFYAVCRMMKRYNSLYRGSFAPDDAEEIDIIGFKSQFSKIYGSETGCLFKTIREAFPEDTAHDEGYRTHNFFGTFLLGSVLIRNPYFARYLLRKMGYVQPHLAYEKLVTDIYRQRLTEFRNPEIRY